MESASFLGALIGGIVGAGVVAWYFLNRLRKELPPVSPPPPCFKPTQEIKIVLTPGSIKVMPYYALVAEEGDVTWKVVGWAARHKVKIDFEKKGALHGPFTDSGTYEEEFPRDIKSGTARMVDPRDSASVAWKYKVVWTKENGQSEEVDPMVILGR